MACCFSVIDICRFVLFCCQLYCFLPFPVVMAWIRRFHIILLIDSFLFNQLLTTGRTKYVSYAHYVTCSECNNLSAHLCQFQQLVIADLSLKCVANPKALYWRGSCFVLGDVVKEKKDLKLICTQYGQGHLAFITTPSLASVISSFLGAVSIINFFYS